jgi:pyridoxine 5-phosphate synthase
MLEGALLTGTDRIEFYTGPYAKYYDVDREAAVAAYTKAAIYAHKLGLGINAGHDLNLDNLAYFKQNCPNLDEVSIGHALVSDALYYGLQNTIRMYLRQLR